MVTLVRFSVCVLAVSSCVPVVIEVSVSPSMVRVLGGDFCAASKSELVEPQSLSLSLLKATCALS